MLQGTGSDVGKSLLAAGLCRLWVKRGLTVRPFKPQNMSNNAAVTADGGEIGRAQALQARACAVPASVHMNPVLLKPQSEIGAQVVVHGKVLTTAKARAYHALKPKLMSAVLESFQKMTSAADLVLIEGAGSPAEVNLRAADIANMGFAEAADVPVALVADIDRGGVIASIVGTYELLPEDERARIKGYIINKFRGDPALFDDAIDIIRARTGLACFGIVPYFADAGYLPKEDAMALDQASSSAPDGKDPQSKRILIAVPRLARIANFDDLDPLMAEPGVDVRIIAPGDAFPGDADAILLPGSKATRADLDVLRTQGWDIDIHAHHRRGGVVIGLCGGYQMLGRVVADPDGREGAPGETAGLGLLDVETVIGGDKALRPVSGRDASEGAPVSGYEIHMGRTTGADCARPWLLIGDDGVPEGARSANGLVLGAYVHGVFSEDAFRRAFLQRLGAAVFAEEAFDARVEDTLDALADHLEKHLEIDALLTAAG